MEVLIDTLGGDKSPEFAITAGIRAKRALQIDIAFAGDGSFIRTHIEKSGEPVDAFRIIEAPQRIGMDEFPVKALEEKPRASILVGMKEVAAGRSQAIVSAGHSGATVVAARRVLGLLPGIRRPALCQVMPATSGKFLLMDVGASLTAMAHDYLGFALMGSVVAQRILHVEHPRIALLNIGTEVSKGSERMRRAGRLLSGSSVNFTGNIEGNELWFHKADIVLTDGLTGNILLKTSEGLVTFLIRSLMQKHPDIPEETFMPDSRFNIVQYGGAPLLGVKGTCIVCHGKSETEEFFGAIKVAIQHETQGVPSALERFLRNFNLNMEEEQ